jgi:hypothetical protein
VFKQKRSIVLVAFAAVVATTAACSADATAPVPAKPLGLKQPAKLDTADLCPYGWLVINGVIVCDEAR